MDSEKILIIKEALHKFKMGDPLSNHEVQILLNFYSDLEFKLKILGEQYHIFWEDIFHKKLKIEDYRRARIHSGKWSITE